MASTYSDDSEYEPDPESDDLTEIKGIGSATAIHLQTAGVHTFAQIADMSPDEICALLQSYMRISAKLIAAHDWIGQAKALAARAPRCSADIGESGQQRYVQFSITLTLAETNEVFRTEALYVQGRTRASWARWDMAKLSDFISAQASVQLQPAITSGANNPVRPAAAPEPEHELAPVIAPPEPRSTSFDEATGKVPAVGSEHVPAMHDYGLVRTSQEPANEAQASSAETAGVSEPTKQQPTAALVIEVDNFDVVALPARWRGVGLGDPQRIQVSAQFHLSGSAASEASARQAVYEFEIQARNLTTNQERVLAAGQAFLRPQVKDYTAQLSFAPPKTGQYRLRGTIRIPQYHVGQDTGAVALTTEH